jgi:hypothetical protein
MAVRIWLDADGCPNEIKRIVFRAAERLEVEAVVVANVPLQTPDLPFVSSVLVSHDFDAADDHIAGAVESEDVVITADVPLAARVVERGAVAIDPRGRVYDESTVGARLATRNLMQELRSAGTVTGGPAPIERKHKAAFAAALDRLLTRHVKKQRG